jgi:hypothetical protein
MAQLAEHPTVKHFYALVHDGRIVWQAVSDGFDTPAYPSKS